MQPRYASEILPINSKLLCLRIETGFDPLPCFTRVWPRSEKGDEIIARAVCLGLSCWPGGLVLQIWMKKSKSDGQFPSDKYVTVIQRIQFLSSQSHLLILRSDVKEFRRAKTEV
jgi:hypothetical protein